jgi:hypothetical protein
MVRFRLFRWPGEHGAGLVGVFQYDFSGANPALSCPSIGLLVHLVKREGNWEVHGRYLLETIHHRSLQRVEPIELTSDGVPELVIESDFGGAGTAGSSLQVFDLRRGAFQELLNTNSRLEYMDQDSYTQVLDVGQTMQTHGQLRDKMLAPLQ